MPNNYQDSSVVVPVFNGINDVPRVPTATEAGNGSDIIARINNLLGFLDTDITDLDSRVSSLESSLESSGNTVTFDLTGISDFDTWFNSGVNGTVYLVIIFLPKILPYFSYDDSLGYVRVDLADLNYSLNSNISSDLSTAGFVAISQNDLPQTTIDLTSFFTGRGLGLYIFMFFDLQQSGGSGSDTINLPTGSSIRINTTDKENIDVVTIARSDNWGLSNQNNMAIKDSSTNNVTYSLGASSGLPAVQALYFKDTSEFQINFTITNEGI